MNNHSILSMFMTVKGHPYSRGEKRSTFFCQNCIAISFAAFAAQLSATEAIAVNILVISPVMILLKTQLYYLLACPCLRSCHEKGGCAGGCASFLESIGWFIVIPFIFICLAALIVATILNDGEAKYAGNHIASYAYSVHVVAAVQEVVMVYVMYFLTGRYSIKMYFCCIPIMTFGKYYNDKVLCGLVEGVDYVKVPKKSYFCGLIKLERVIEKELWESSACGSCCSTKSAAIVPVSQEEDVLPVTVAATAAAPVEPVVADNNEYQPVPVAMEIEKEEEV
jgi:hypothetical protein